MLTSLLPDRRLDSPAIQRRLRELRRTPVNYAPDLADTYTAATGWRVDDRRVTLPAEPPGPPQPGRSFAVARRLMWGYEFADPSMVHAFYDPEEPLEGRTMLLELRFRGLLRFDCGTRVAVVWDEQRELDGRTVHVWGWAYRTLEGHVEQGQMDWQVWKWDDTGAVEFRIHAYSRRAAGAPIPIRLGFRVVGRHEQLAFLDGTLVRMRRLVEAALADGSDRGGAVLREAERLTARSGYDTQEPHERLARRVDTPLTG